MASGVGAAVHPGEGQCAKLVENLRRQGRERSVLHVRGPIIGDAVFKFYFARRFLQPPMRGWENEEVQGGSPR